MRGPAATSARETGWPDMHRLIVFVAVATLASSGLSRPLGAQAATAASLGAEEQAVLATVQRLFDAMRAKDTAAFRDIFEPNAKLVGMRTRQNGEQVVQVLPWDRFASFMASEDRKSTRLNSSHLGIS